MTRPMFTNPPDSELRRHAINMNVVHTHYAYSCEPTRGLSARQLQEWAVRITYIYEHVTCDDCKAALVECVLESDYRTGSLKF